MSNFFIPDGRNLDDLLQGSLGGGRPDLGPQFFTRLPGQPELIFDLRYAIREVFLTTPPVNTGFFAFERDISCIYKAYSRPTFAFDPTKIPNNMYGDGNSSWGGVSLRFGGDFAKGEIFAMVSANSGPTQIDTKDYALGYLKADRIQVKVSPRYTARAEGFDGPTDWVTLSTFRSWSYTKNGGFLEIMIEFRSLDNAFAQTRRFAVMRNTNTDGGGGRT